MRSSTVPSSIRALSPGINDPYTAVAVIDRLAPDHADARGAVDARVTELGRAARGELDLPRRMRDDEILSAMRKQFGGHVEKPAAQES